MNFIISALSQLIKFFGAKALKFSKQLAQFGVVVLINSGLVLSFVAYFAAIIALILWLFSQFNSLLQRFANVSGDDMLTMGFRVLRSIGVWDGVVDAFTILSFGFISLFVMFLSKLVVKALLQLRVTVLSLIISLQD
jgi:hypothetical protein|nr:hypothetical protein [uncultured Campylobacter sp.]